MASVRTTFTLDEELAGQARRLGVNVSAAARDGVRDAVYAAMAREDRTAYERHPEEDDDGWMELQAWSAE